jgi:hypothetical protein
MSNAIRGGIRFGRPENQEVAVLSEELMLEYIDPGHISESHVLFQLKGS